MMRGQDLAESSLEPTDHQSLARRIEILEATVFRLTAELDRLSNSAGQPSSSSSQSQRIVFDAIMRRIEAAGGEVRATTSEIAAEVGLHQTYVAAIIKTLEADDRLIASGKRTRSYRLPNLSIA